MYISKCKIAAVWLIGFRINDHNKNNNKYNCV